jgi:starch synthase (maltosyl-transferring)
MTKPRKSRQSSESESSSFERIVRLAERRIVIEGVWPEIDGGRFAAKRAVRDIMRVEADIFSDGHDKVNAATLYRKADETHWREAPMCFVDNDRWRAEFRVEDNARYFYTIIAWRNLFASWRDEASKKRVAGQPLTLELTEAQLLLETTLKDSVYGTFDDRVALKEFLRKLSVTVEESEKFRLLTSPEISAVVSRMGVRTNLTHYPKELELWVDRRAAAFSAWYEIFPRSQSGDVDRHGTFADVITRLPYVRDLGFDVLYLTPIHPIGRTNRKGRNNSVNAEPGDPGSPYAIGSKEGGHDAIHPELGNLNDFRRLVAAAHEHGLEIAIDFAVQCSPDHPWIKSHPEWFDWRPDGTIKFAENPPKTYEDIVNAHFYRKALPSIWFALRDIVLFWADKGVRVFRVDNPHTKPFPFWEWMIGEVHQRYADIIFLSEAFTRPKPMKRLAKLGFTQSYTYFTWRNTKTELTEYLSELTGSECREYFRPNFFTTTPDINPFYLQTSGRAGFQARLVLAATLSGNYGIYNGFELCQATPLAGKEEYFNSEKYELKAWNWDREGHIREDVRLMNRVRREHPALQQFLNLRFYNAWNDQILYYGKISEDRQDFVLIAVNLDPHNPQGADFEVPLWEFGLNDEASIGVEDLTNGQRFTWSGKIQHMLLDPAQRPYALWRLLPPQRKN